MEQACSSKTFRFRGRRVVLAHLPHPLGASHQVARCFVRGAQQARPPRPRRVARSAERRPASGSARPADRHVVAIFVYRQVLPFLLFFGFW